MDDLEIQKYIEDNCRNIEGGEMMDEQAFYEGAKWYRDNVVNKLPIHNVSNLLCGSFDLDAKTSSATKCKCGREKWEHPKAT